MHAAAGGSSPHKLITWVNGVYWRRYTECGVCVEVCKEYEHNAITIVNGAASIDKTKCDMCLWCMQLCPYDCIDIWKLFVMEAPGVPAE